MYYYWKTVYISLIDIVISIALKSVKYHFDLERRESRSDGESEMDGKTRWREIRMSKRSGDEGDAPARIPFKGPFGWDGSFAGLPGGPYCPRRTIRSERPVRRRGGLGKVVSRDPSRAPNLTSQSKRSKCNQNGVHSPRSSFVPRCVPTMLPLSFTVHCRLRVSQNTIVDITIIKYNYTSQISKHPGALRAASSYVCLKSNSRCRRNSEICNTDSNSCLDYHVCILLFFDLHTASWWTISRTCAYWSPRIRREKCEAAGTARSASKRQISVANADRAVLTCLQTDQSSRRWHPAGPPLVPAGGRRRRRDPTTCCATCWDLGQDQSVQQVPGSLNNNLSIGCW